MNSLHIKEELDSIEIKKEPLSPTHANVSFFRQGFLSKKIKETNSVKVEQSSPDTSHDEEPKLSIDDTKPCTTLDLNRTNKDLPTGTVIKDEPDILTNDDNTIFVKEEVMDDIKDPPPDELPPRKEPSEDVRQYKKKHLLNICDDEPDIESLKYKCSRCSERFSDYWDLIDHIYDHTEECSILCSACNSGFKASMYKRFHKECKGAYFTCLLCGKVSHELKAALNHQKTHIIFEVPCPYCLYLVKLKCNIHPRFKKITCAICKCGVEVNEFSMHRHLHRCPARQANGKPAIREKCEKNVQRGTVQSVREEIENNKVDSEYFSSRVLRRYQNKNTGRTYHECPKCKERIINKQTFCEHIVACTVRMPKSTKN